MSHFILKCACSLVPESWESCRKRNGVGTELLRVVSRFYSVQCLRD